MNLCCRSSVGALVVLFVTIVHAPFAQALENVSVTGSIEYDGSSRELVGDWVCFFTLPYFGSCILTESTTPFSDALDPATLTLPYDETLQHGGVQPTAGRQALAVRADGIDAFAMADASGGCDETPIGGPPGDTKLTFEASNVESRLAAAFDVAASTIVTVKGLFVGNALSHLYPSEGWVRVRTSSGTVVAESLFADDPYNNSTGCISDPDGCGLEVGLEDALAPGRYVLEVGTLAVGACYLVDSVPMYPRYMTSLSGFASIDITLDVVTVEAVPLSSSTALALLLGAAAVRRLSRRTR